MSPLLDAALRYATDRGWPVFPLKARGKRPILPGGFHIATTDPAQITTWWGRWPDANIGIPCKENTFCVVDIDPAHGGNDTYQALRDEYGDFPDTLMQITGSGGAHYCFQPDERVGNTEAKVGEGIDTRGNNKGYIAVAPSMHELGKQYAWHDPDAPLADIPEWIVKLLQPKEVVPVADPTPTSRAPLNRNGVEERARAYLQQCEPAVQGNGGHSKLLWACTAMVHGYELDNSTAYQLLASEYNPRCSPPWDLSLPAELKEFKRKISEGRKEKTKRRGWLLEEMEQPDEALMQHARECAAALIQSSRIVEYKIPPAPKQLPFDDDVDVPQQAELPSHAMHPPGLVGDLVSFINKTARKPQPLLALATSYAFCGALFGRKIRDAWNLRTNIYCLGVAESGAGKDHSRQFIKDLCAEAGIHEDLLGGEEVTSDTAIATRLDRSPAVLFLWDEIGHMLASLKADGATGHRKGIVPYLMRLTGSASGVFIGKEFADGGKRVDVVQPNVCIYGTTVPSVLYNGLTSAEIRDGLLGRLLVFRARDDDPDVNDEGSRAREIPADLVERVQAWFNFRPEAPDGTPDIQRHKDCYQITVPTDKRAQALFLELRADVRQRRNKAISEHSPQAPLWSRVEEHARRIALITSAGDCQTPDSARVTEDHAKSACQLVLYLMSHFVEATAANIADSESERWYKRIREIVLASRAKGIKHSNVTRRTQALSRRQRDDILQSLIDSGDVIRQQVNGKRACMYFCPPFGDAEEVEMTSADKG